MGTIVHINDTAFTKVTGALDNAGQDYKNKLARLDSLMQEIKAGTIQGDVAEDLLAKYEEKKPIFNKVASTIDEANGYLGNQDTKFGSVNDEIEGQVQ